MFKRLIEPQDERIGRFFAIIIQFLIVASMICFSIETVPNLSEGTRRFLDWKSEPLRFSPSNIFSDWPMHPDGFGSS
jgi:large-conductance mechanosensitive channel